MRFVQTSEYLGGSVSIRFRKMHQIVEFKAFETMAFSCSSKHFGRKMLVSPYSGNLAMPLLTTLSSGFIVLDCDSYCMRMA